MEKIKLVLLRHGESTWNKENKFTGWTDVDLSIKGIEEAKELVDRQKKEVHEIRDHFVKQAMQIRQRLTDIQNNLG